MNQSEYLLTRTLDDRSLDLLRESFDRTRGEVSRFEVRFHALRFAIDCQRNGAWIHEKTAEEDAGALLARADRFAEWLAGGEYGVEATK